MATKMEPVNLETENKQLRQELATLREKETLMQTQLTHFVDELRFVLGIAIQARPEIEEIKVMAKELYRVGK